MTKENIFPGIGILLQQFIPVKRKSKVAQPRAMLQGQFVMSVKDGSTTKVTNL
jgi:hypothetical protein